MDLTILFKELYDSYLTNSNELTTEPILSAEFNDKSIDANNGESDENVIFEVDNQKTALIDNDNDDDDNSEIVIFDKNLEGGNDNAEMLEIKTSITKSKEERKNKEFESLIEPLLYNYVKETDLPDLSPYNSDDYD